MIRRRRIAALLERLSAWVFSEFAQAWQQVPQDDLDALLDAAEHPFLGAS